ncbi:MAG: helix-turn-helix transcriptional regulator [Magnetococcales bacterium]|nr:helix-turn-helix transcriptional regulator [Magnetococcales bacterium]
MNDRQKLMQREILLGFWKVHILHHAGEGPVVGHWMLQELRHHGYDVSPGTLYPLLKRMEKNGWLSSEQDLKKGPKSPKRYLLTNEGRQVLALAKQQARELCRETTPSDTEDGEQ